MPYPTYTTDVPGEVAYVEPHDLVQDRHTGTLGSVTEVRPNGLVYVKWDGCADECVESPENLFHL